MGEETDIQGSADIQNPSQMPQWPQYPIPDFPYRPFAELELAARVVTRNYTHTDVGFADVGETIIGMAEQFLKFTTPK